MQLRPYQQSAIAAVDAHLQSTAEHGVVALPTGAGKTVIFATLIRQWIEEWPWTRVVVLAHRQELLEQAEAKIKAVWPEAPVGIWSAGLGRRDAGAQILVAGIQSIYRRAADFEPFHVVIVDECHLVPLDDETMYRRFLSDLEQQHEYVRCIGFTATPYRMDGGDLCGPDRFFRKLIYQANIKKLIEDGYLCNLSTKAANAQLDTDGVHTRGGDFVPGELERAVNTAQQVEDACDEIVRLGEGRTSWLVFCCGVAHARRVSAALESRGISAPIIIGDTDTEDRQEILRRFDAGDLRCVVNVNCLTTGLDVTRIDLIAVLRPTKSTSLWVQMVGRGLRLHPGKEDCRVLDFGGNAMRHGPLDKLRVRKKGDGDGEAPVKKCPQCQEVVPAAMLTCPACNYEFPGRKAKHDTKPDTTPLLSGPAQTFYVQRVTLARHEKPLKPPSLRVTYWCGVRTVSEWVCFEHSGFAQHKAHLWWRRRFGHVDPPATIDEAIATISAEHLAAITESIDVDMSGQFPQIVKLKLRKLVNT